MFGKNKASDTSRAKLERIYNNYKDILYKSAIDILHDRTLAEDAVHETMIRVYNNLHKIDESLFYKTAAFLVTICRNIAIDIYNEKLDLNTNPETIEFIPDNISCDPLDLIVKFEKAEEVKKCINSLSPACQNIIIHKIYLDYSYEEISKLLNISQETARKRFERAKNQLIQLLEKEKLS